MKKIFGCAAAFAVFGISVALAGPIEDRHDLMESFEKVEHTAGAMARPGGAFDAAAAKAQLDILVDGAAKIPGLFPAGSDSSAGKTRALPTVWSDAAGFSAAAAKLGTDAKAAEAATDQASFAAAWQTVTADCSACHRTYRAAPARPAAPPPAAQ